MDLATLTLKALIQHADKLPDAALPDLGSIAHLGLWLSAVSRRRFFRAIDEIFSWNKARSKRGSQQLLNIAGLDHDLAKDALRDAIRLRRAVAPMEMEHVVKFFRALRGATLLRDYYGLIVDVFESEGEDIMLSITDGTAFRKGGLVSILIEEPSATAPKGKPGRKTFTADIAAFVNELRLQRKTWKEVFHACKDEFPGVARNSEQVRTIWRRHFGNKSG